jgi:hypothetical protein
MQDTISLPALTWAIIWRAAIGAIIFYYGLERIDMADRMLHYAHSIRPMDADRYRYFFLDRPHIIREYLTPLFVWWLGGSMICLKKGGKISWIGAAVFVVAALPFAAYYAFCALTIAMGVGFIGALLAGLVSILGPLYLIEPLFFFGFVVSMIGSLE